MDKSREQFEAWWKDTKLFLFHSENGPTKSNYFKIWQASRASIEVEFPALCGDGENDTDYTEGLNDGINQCTRSITSLGLKVKDHD